MAKIERRELERALALLLECAQEWEVDGVLDSAALHHRAEVLDFLAQHGLVEIVDEISERWVRAVPVQRGGNHALHT